MADTKSRPYLSGWSGLTYTDIANLVGKTLTATEQNVITDLITSIELFICNQTNRQFKYSGMTYYETVDAGKFEYLTANFPINVISKITVDGNIKYQVDGVNNVLTLGTDLFVYEDHIRITQLIPSAIDNSQAMKIYYSISQFWGADVTLAIKRLVADLFLSKEYGTKGVTSIGISGGLNLSFDNISIANYLKAIINQYRAFNV